jgi:ubiquinone/menaquinone biosynthesis C-methylase UbiE
MDSSKRLREARQYWDNQADRFDDEPDHGLHDPVVRDAWKNLLMNWLPSHPGKVLDIGCGTGSLSVLMAELGHQVTGIDLSPAMIARANAKAKAADYSISFQVMDASNPELTSHQFKAIVCRHLLWALPDHARVLQRWSNLLAPNGRLLLIEGYWNNSGGLYSDQIVDVLPSSCSRVIVKDLSDYANLWGGAVADERYMVKADRVY